MGFNWFDINLAFEQSYNDPKEETGKWQLILLGLDFGSEIHFTCSSPW